MAPSLQVIAISRKKNLSREVKVENYSVFIFVTACTLGTPVGLCKQLPCMPRSDMTHQLPGAVHNKSRNNSISYRVISFINKEKADKMDTKKISIKPGEKYKIFFAEDNPNNETIHVRSIIDEDQVVYMKISNKKQSLSYHIGSVYYFDLLREGGVFIKAG